MINGWVIAKFPFLPTVFFAGRMNVLKGFVGQISRFTCIFMIS